MKKAYPTHLEREMDRAFKSMGSSLAEMDRVEQNRVKVYQRYVEYLKLQWQMIDDRIRALESGRAEGPKFKRALICSCRPDELAHMLRTLRDEEDDNDGR